MAWPFPRSSSKAKRRGTGSWARPCWSRSGWRRTSSTLPAGALHGSEVAAGALGIDAAAHKLSAFVISALFAATAGALSAHYSGFITPAKASFLHSVELVTMVVFGGMASTFGAVVGAAVLTTLPQFLSVFKEYEMVLLGAVMMLTMIFMPRGLVPTLERALAAARRIGR